MDRGEAFTAIHPRTAQDDFRTPPYLLDYIGRTRAITHDGACSEANATGEPFDLFQEGQLLPPGSHLFVNPPWDTPSVKRFVKAAWFQMMRSPGSRVTFLLPNKLCEVAWVEDIMPYFDWITFLGGRVNFEGPNSVKGGASRWGSVLCEISRKVPSPIPTIHYKTLKQLKEWFQHD